MVTANLCAKDTGYKEQFGFPGLGRLTVMDMFQRSVPVAFTGVLYVFRNDFWVSSQEALNITHFDTWCSK